MANDGEPLRGVQFRTVPLTNREADALQSDLGDAADVANVYLAGDDGDEWSGAVLPHEQSELILLEIAERLRDDPRIVGASVAPGRFPDRPL